MDFYFCWLHKDGFPIKHCTSIRQAALFIAEREGLNRDKIYRSVCYAFHACTPYQGYMVTEQAPAGSYGISKAQRRREAHALLMANQACDAARSFYATSGKR